MSCLRKFAALVISAYIVLGVPVAMAQTAPADSTIAAAVKDLDRLEAQAKKLTPQRSSGANRIGKLLGLTEQRLQSSTHKDDPSFKAAQDRIAALKQFLADVTSGKTPGAATGTASGQTAPAQAAPAPASQSAASGTEQRMKQALMRMRELEVAAERVTPAQPQSAIEIVKALNAMTKMVVVNEDKSHPRWGELVQRHGKLKSAMLTLATGAYAQRMSNVTAKLKRELAATDPVTVQEAAETAKWRKIITDGREQMSTLPDQKHPNVAALGGALDDLEKLLEEKLAFVPKPPVTIDNIWNADWPMDEPVLIDTIGPIETTVLVQMNQGRPASWVPEPTLLVRFPDYAKDDVIVMQVLDDGDEIGKPMKCGAQDFVKPLALAMFTCRPGKEFGLTQAGDFEVKVTYVQTLLQKEHELATLKLPVVELKHGSRNDPEIVFGDDMDARLNVSTIEETGGKGGPVALTQAASGKFGRYGHNAMITAFDAPESVPHALIRTWFKAGNNMIPTNITCFKGDKKIGEAQHFGNLTRSTWTYDGDGKKQETWTRVEYDLHNVLFRPRYGGDKTGYEETNGYFYLSDNPGEYRCVVTGNGEILKELYFTIGDEGVIEKPSCQAESIKTLRHLTLLRQENKKVAFVPYDEDAGEDYGFYGNAEWEGDCPLVE